MVPTPKVLIKDRLILIPVGETEKTDDPRTISVEARLVAKGFQEENKQREDSPNLKKTSMRCLYLQLLQITDGI